MSLVMILGNILSPFNTWKIRNFKSYKNYKYFLKLLFSDIISYDIILLIFCNFIFHFKEIILPNLKNFKEK